MQRVSFGKQLVGRRWFGAGTSHSGRWCTSLPLLQTLPSICPRRHFRLPKALLLFSVGSTSLGSCFCCIFLCLQKFIPKVQIVLAQCIWVPLCVDRCVFRIAPPPGTWRVPVAAAFLALFGRWIILCCVGTCCFNCWPHKSAVGVKAAACVRLDSHGCHPSCHRHGAGFHQGESLSSPVPP